MYFPQSSAYPATMSDDGTVLLLTCYDAPIGYANPWVIAYNVPTPRRVVARIYADGSIDTSTFLKWTPFTTIYADGVTNAATVNGSSEIYVSGQEYYYQNGRVRAIPAGAGGVGDFDVALPALTISRIKAANGTLYLLGGYYSPTIYQVGPSGTPPLNASAPLASVTALPGFPAAYTGAGTISSYLFQTSSILWVSDSGYTGSGLWRFVYNVTLAHWVKDVVGPWSDPSNQGCVDIAGRQEGNV